MDEKPKEILQKAIEEIYKKFGVRIKHSTFTWINISSYEKAEYQFLCAEIEAELQ